MNVNPGTLNKRIAILQIEEEKDNEGYRTKTATTVQECWACFTRTSGTEMIRANADFGQVRSRFLIRYTEKPIHRKMVVRYNGQDHEIVYVNDYEDRHEYIEIWCVTATQGVGL